MNVEVAGSAGFCFGVKRAIGIVEDELNKNEGTPIYTYGPIIHNEQVVESYIKRGVCPIDEGRPLSDYDKGIVIIRSHGAASTVHNSLKEAGHTVVDATCPFVKKIHDIVKDKSSAGYHIIIIGSSTHPEVLGIKGQIASDDVSIISSPIEAECFDLEVEKKICIVSQTTYNHNKFQECVEIIRQKGYDIVAVNTICNATFDRQREARELARRCDIMIVIGGKHSSNTQKLYDICLEECNSTYYIQTKDDLDLSIDQSIGSIGITAGASTPNNFIEEVQTQCQKVLNKC